ncbi:hypothetical protein [Rathayibacter sp. SD072]|uniref:hypothetical protein n=1 Tax=Rathayibacter sp. SD072 TaxID=2781731 RepID=UPI001A9748AD|nr:hypothetical protein [Rathayibacter sp. SD072]MBO0983660.1 hypothetical protein [Rathayibacter sp. SD072]
MITLFLVLVLLALIPVAVFGLSLIADDCPEKQVRRAQVRAEADIDAHHRAALRAMNDAAGQSWRNLVE